ncbi:MBL fold metallo-hydrolase [Fulvivirga sediminis]|uniref:MBL fold metallo-hydrolase n=1 Tax=Fulvivirga sediminis TaxID=2803949 RepID=A0A937K022_9BACT|nr:MBL fold metallo-hydrolase [Fulvivirga sediminis]MBL3657219.1 MBL fold metallo-hydrolase [Fulvivirga sediminis]
MKNLKNSVIHWFLSAGTVFLLTAIVSISVYGQANGVKLDQPGYYRLAIGEIEVIAVSDGTLPIDLLQVLTNTTPKEVNELLADNFQSNPVAVSVNAYLIKLQDKLILVDCGAAELYGPTLGNISTSLKRAGYTPEQIDAILITHIHADHTGGLVSEGKMVFPNADIYISKGEIDFWLDPQGASKRPDLKKSFADAQAKVGPYLKAGKVKAFDSNKELFPGIKPIPSPGHTPGHTFYALENHGEKILFWGDLMHVESVQFANPSVTIAFDVDSEKAAIARKKAYHEAANEGYWVASDHISFPGIGHVKAEKKNYVWVPINYSTYSSGQ